MTRAHLWIALLAGLSFLAGGAVGALLASAFEPRSPLVGPFADFERRFAAAFDPDSEQSRKLRKILLKYQSSEEEIKNRFAQRMEPDLANAGRIAEERLLGILTPKQKTLYDELLAAGDSLQPAAGNGR